MVELERSLRDLARSNGVPGAAAAAGRLARRAADAGLVEVAYAHVGSPLGPLLVAATRRGLVRLSLDAAARDEVLGELSAAVSPRVLEVPARLDEARRQLDEYFEGSRRAFDLPLDLRLVDGFRRRVLATAEAIPFGSVATYAEVAVQAGSACAARAAGSALAANPIPIVVPCHRVLRTGGKLGGYVGGLERKRFLLELEGARV
ncbi:MAG: methylated-DNA--[protein]-cysteine S-methyltransferase [Actinomycetota bacterium]